MRLCRALSFFERIFKKRGNFSESIRKTIRKSNIIPSDRFDIAFFRYDAIAMEIFAAPSIFSILHLCSVGANCVRPLETAGLPYGVPTGRPRLGHLRRIQHIFNENAVPRGGVVDKHMGYSSHELAAGNAVLPF